MNLPAISVPKAGISLGVSKYIPFAMPVGSLVISILVAYFVIWPKFGEVLSMRTSNQQLEVQASQLNEKAQTLTTLSQDKPTLEKQLAQSEQLLPSKNGIFPLLREIEVASATSGVLVEKVDVDPKSLSSGGGQGSGAPAPPPDKNASSVSGLSPAVVVKVALTGGYRSFLDFLSYLYNGSRVISIDDLSLTSSSGKEGGGGVVRAAITINAFWRPLPTNLGTLDKPVDKLSSAEVGRLNAVVTVPTEQASSSAVPQVPMGRSDLFAPF